MISLKTAKQLLDFTSGGRQTKEAAAEQLEGAVAIHNILDQHRIAYLGDEVGMGKTYVALGAFALFRHYDPTFRLLVIAPRENIQDKWIKELKNFVRNNVLFSDLRVKSIHGAPARPPVKSSRLTEFIRDCRHDPDRDFFLRLPSFSIGLGDSPDSWLSLRDRLRAELPWLDESALSLKGKSAFKDNFARAICCALPVFDLVIIDEAHKLKHGWGSDAARNRTLALSLGFDDPDDPTDTRIFKRFGPRAKRVLLLSATPVEDNYRHLYNQLHLFRRQELASPLVDNEVPEQEKKETARKFLVRRVTTIRNGDRRLTKNLYRREWRKGGVSLHDEPLAVPDDRQRLVVALVQKKVSELIGSEKFNNSFQIGMLASFESFMQTAKARQADEQPVFDDTDTSISLDERQGIDVDTMNALAKHYRDTFGDEMPHPKMDALVDRLSSYFEQGRKALIFVRRIASVTELKRKLEKRYDDWIIDHLRRSLRTEELLDDFEALAQKYLKEREAQEAATQTPASGDDETESGESTDRGGNETFFAWYFRGERRFNKLTGGALAKRFTSQAAWFSTFFDENYVAALLECGGSESRTKLAEALALEPESLDRRLNELASWYVTGTKTRRSIYFHAYQFAALKLLSDSHSPHASRARTIVEEKYSDAVERKGPEMSSPQWLDTETFFTRLRAFRDGTLYRELMQGEASLPATATGFREAFRRQEFRRSLLSTVFRLGHGFIDLYVATVNHLGSLALGVRDDAGDNALIDTIVEMLDAQRGASGRFAAWNELYEVASHFDILMDANFHELRNQPLAQAARTLGMTLGSQQPVGGMSQQVNKTLVSQFRMPGYPFILVTTDLLQEGEDLHTFCSEIYHYGISWMPSSMEQRIGRIDRVNSHTQRRLTRTGARDVGETNDEMLQVFYPYLQETVERYQVDRVLERMSSFIRLMHQNLSVELPAAGRTIDSRKEVAFGVREIPRITETLESAFPVQKELIDGDEEPLPVARDAERSLRARFDALKHLVPNATGAPKREGAMHGAAKVGARQQPFTLMLHSVQGLPCVRCVSPVGEIRDHVDLDALERLIDGRPVRIGAARDEKRDDVLHLTVEGDVLLTEPEHDAMRVSWLLDNVCHAADELEFEVFEGSADSSLEALQTKLDAEDEYER